tara:strand:- start:9790 stop:9939 length:150 start_codon:yes stop_codon:yes gene_type:complete
VKRASFKKCDHKQTLSGKGDLRRPEQAEKFSDGWDRIYGKPKDKESTNK